MNAYESHARAERRRYIDAALARAVLSLDLAIRRMFCAVLGSHPCR